MIDVQRFNPEEHADDPRVSYMVTEWKRLSRTEQDAEELVQVDPAMRELADKEIDEIQLEVRAGVGGEEASLFAEELAAMYLRYAESRGWKSKPLDESRGSMGG